MPEYRQRLAERMGFYPHQLPGSLWIHAVSVGEALAAVPLIKAILLRYPSLPIVVTTMTPTGGARIKSAFGDAIIHYYIPYDTAGAVKRFLKAINPQMGIIMETELWPNLLHLCQQKNIPVCLVNARLSAKSAKGYQRIAHMTQRMLQSIKVIAAHGQPDAERFIALGAPPENVIVTGNLKFDIELPHDLGNRAQKLRMTLGKERFIWVAASTHEGEEEMILKAHKKVRVKDPQALLILVPRHPDRFDRIAKICEQAFITQRRSQEQPCPQETGVYLADTMGELLLMYSVADLAFIGGSLIPRGGHNILEPAALGKAMLTGPHVFNFAEITHLFHTAQALTKVTTAEELAEQVCHLMTNTQLRDEMGKKALQVIGDNKGALGKQLELIARYMPAA